MLGAVGAADEEVQMKDFIGEIGVGGVKGLKGGEMEEVEDTAG